MDAVDIIGWERYKIYPDGRIWSKLGKGRFLKPNINRCGYYRIRLSNNKKIKIFSIHRLLMQHFKPDEWNENLCVDHINRIRADNRLENLRMVTNQENGQNQGTSKNNTSGYKNIRRHRASGGWRFKKRINKLTYIKYFKTLDEVIEFKTVFCVIHNVENN